MEYKTKELIEFITQSVYFGEATLESEGMSLEIWDKYLHLGAKMFRKPGEYIIRIGENPGGLYFIKKGRVKTNLLSKDGMVKTIGIRNDKTIFGEQFIFHHQPGIFEASAIDDCELYYFTREIILVLMSIIHSEISFYHCQNDGSSNS